jgi:hypothetical protein
MAMPKTTMDENYFSADDKGSCASLWNIVKSKNACSFGNLLFYHPLFTAFPRTDINLALVFEV